MWLLQLGPKHPAEMAAWLQEGTCSAQLPLLKWWCCQTRTVMAGWAARCCHWPNACSSSGGSSAQWRGSGRAVLQGPQAGRAGAHSSGSPGASRQCRRRSSCRGSCGLQQSTARRVAALPAVLEQQWGPDGGTARPPTAWVLSSWPPSQPARPPTAPSHLSSSSSSFVSIAMTPPLVSLPRLPVSRAPWLLTAHCRRWE